MRFFGRATAGLQTLKWKLTLGPAIGIGLLAILSLAWGETDTKPKLSLIEIRAV